MTTEISMDDAVAELERVCDSFEDEGAAHGDAQTIAYMRKVIADWRRLAHRVDEIDDPLPLVGTGMPGSIYLDLFGHWLREAFPDSTAVHVGSSATSKQWRDVDIRLIMPDEPFGELFPGYNGHHQNDVKWALLSAAIAELGKKLTGFPIDFQFQRRGEATDRYGSKFREPLDLYAAPDIERD
jgi:hypothetical protein